MTHPVLYQLFSCVSSDVTVQAADIILKLFCTEIPDWDSWIHPETGLNIWETALVHSYPLDCEFIDLFFRRGGRILWEHQTRMIQHCALGYNRQVISYLHSSGLCRLPDAVFQPDDSPHVLDVVACEDLIGTSSVRHLLDIGYKVSPASIHHAVCTMQWELAEMLLQYPFIDNFEWLHEEHTGMTAIDLAVLHGNPQVASQLISHK